MTLSRTALLVTLAVFVAVAYLSVWRNASAAIITVTTESTAVAADNECSLPEAIDDANDDALTHADCEAGTGEDMIAFAVGVTTITLTADLPAISDADGLTIDGGGDVTISGDNTYLPFIISGDAGLALHNVTVTNGAMSAIINNGTLEITDSEITNSNAPSGGGITNFDGGTASISGTTITGNSALSGSGGAIFNEGILTLNTTTVTGNSAAMHGGGIFNSGLGTVALTNTTVSSSTSSIDGGGIYNELGAVNLVDSTVSGNMATEQGGGIWNNDQLTLNNSDVNGLNVAQFGGGIWNDTAGTVTLTNGSSLSGNMASVNGGGILSQNVLSVSESTVSDNTAANFGGGINGSGTVTITDSTVSGNTATTQGGGGFEFQGGTLTITNSTVSGNTSATRGGGIDNVEGATANISGSTISGNITGGHGGGMFNEDASNANIVNSTVSGNTAGFGGGMRSNTGGLALGNSTVSGNTAAFGGGIYNGDQNTTGLTNVTITNNTATTSGGGVYSPSDAPGDVVMRNTIIAAQQVGGDCAGTTFISMDNNLDSDNTCNLDQPFDIPAGVANLGPLADNGGPTLTHALLPGSEAIDAGDDGVCAADPIFNVDQRGVERPLGEHCDVGAYEAAPPTPTPSPTPSATDAPTPSPTATQSTAPTPSPTPGGPTPVERDLVWADANCSEIVDPVDSLLTLRHDADLSVNTAGCPPLGTEVEVLEVAAAGLTGPQMWGDADCNGAINPVDSLKILRHDARLSVSQEAGCPPIGASVTIQHEP